MPYQDFEEFIASFERHGVRYLIVGAHAVALHARPRATKDLDLLIEPTKGNAQKALAAIRDFFGGANIGYSVKDIVDPHLILQLGVAPVRIDLISRILGCPSFRALWKNRVIANFGEVQANYIGFEDLIAAKKAAARPQDIADIHNLNKVKDRTKRRLPRKPPAK